MSGHMTGDGTVDMCAWPYPRYVAHRGAGKLVPENTLAAMRVGFSHGYRMVEFDVKLTGRRRGVPKRRHQDLVAEPFATEFTV